MLIFNNKKHKHIAQTMISDGLIFTVMVFVGCNSPALRLP
jgi:hypothetical protein